MVLLWHSAGSCGSEEARDVDEDELTVAHRRIGYTCSYIEEDKPCILAGARSNPSMRQHFRPITPEENMCTQL